MSSLYDEIAREQYDDECRKREAAWAASKGSALLPPPGYVMLVEGQKIKAGDLYCRGVGHSWHETRIKHGYWTEHGNYPMCRKLSAKALA